MTEQNITDRYLNLINAVDAERKHDEVFFKKLHESKSIQEKVHSGFVWYPVELLRTSYTIGDYVEIEVKKTKNTNESHKFTEGVAASFFNVQAERTHIRCTVVAVRNDRMKILVHADQIEKEGIPEKGLSGIEMIYDDRPYKVMISAVRTLLESKEPHLISLRKAVGSGNIMQNLGESNDEEIVRDLKYLNQSQKEAVQMCSRIPNIGIIHGPPGTGKTTTLVALTELLVKSEKRVLVCASSNNAVDLLSERISAQGISVLRIGNITRIHDDLIHLTIDEKVRNHSEWAHIKKVRIQARESDKKASQYKRQFGVEERDQRKEWRKEARDLRKWATELEDRLIDSIINSSQVIATTLIGVSNKVLKDMSFQTVVIDEASQALEPECWNAIIKAKRVILAGDHKQLPPTIKSTDALKLGLETTILDIMTEKMDKCALLDTQYRMHDTILSFSNKRFYGGKLISHPDIGKRKLRNDNIPLVFIDTAGCGFEEAVGSESKSYTNEGEYLIIREHILLNIEKLKGVSIGIISPYKDQVRYIRQQICEEDELSQLDIEVNSIDGFQGQEKEVIYISLVRSNDNGDIGFLKDERRLNVAMTRAQKKLIIVGDSATIAQNELFASVISHIETEGYYESAWNYMGY